jgi:hypothetical protein
LFWFVLGTVVGARLFDQAPGQIMLGERLRDATLTNSDYFGILLDTYLDRQNGFVFSTTPAGIEYDGQVVKEWEGGGVIQQGQARAQAGSMGGFNLNWDGNWDVATSIDTVGWVAEFRIPFSTLRYRGGAEQTWGFNLVRSIRRRNEESFWSPIPRQFNFMRVSRAGTLQGLKVPQRRQLTVTPYVLGSAQRDYLSQTSFQYPREFGTDAKVGLTPSLTLDATYNTDFAQVEIDEQRTNLTRFPLFFPEKRPFFLENAGIFSAGTPQAADLFFSRRIGITPAGTPAPIIGGGRLTGKAADLNVGVLQIFTDDVAGVQPGNSYSVARVNRELPSRSLLGAIFIQRMATNNSANYNRTFGLDGRLGLGEATTIDAWGAATRTPGRTGREEAFSVRAAYQTGDWNNNVRFLQVGEDFNPEVGFLNRLNYRLYEFQLLRNIRVPSLPWLRQLNPHINYRGHFDFTGFHQNDFIHFDVEAEFADGGRIGPELNFYKEGLQAPFTIAPGVVIPPGNYSWVQNGWDIASNPSAPLSAVVRLDLGSFYTGTRYGGRATLTGRAAALTTSLIVDHNEVRLSQGDFHTSLLGWRFGYFFTPRVFLQSLLQYSNQAQVWSANIRFGWLNSAGTGLFIVYNEGQSAFGLTDLNQVLSRSLVVKYTHQFSLSRK